MDIDITEFEQPHLLKLISIYPNGHLEIKFGERIFWCSQEMEPRMPQPHIPNPAYPAGYAPQKSNQIQQASRTMKRMSDQLGALMG